MKSNELLTDRTTSAGPESVSPSEALWNLIDHPFRPIEAVRSLFGLNPDAARFVVARELLTSDESERLLDACPELVRHMRNGIGATERRSAGAVTGPISWHSTIAARAAAGFPDDLFVCARPYRDFDLPENQLFKHALSELVDAGRYVSAYADGSFSDERLSVAREQARRAKEYLALRCFDHVKPVHGPGTLRRIARGKDRVLYQPVVEFIPRSIRPLGPWALTHLADRRSALQHKIVLAVLATLRREGIPIRPLVARNGVLTAGPMEYRNPGARGLSGAHGIRGGELLLDVPDFAGDEEGARRRLGQRSGTLTPLMVRSITDVDQHTERMTAAVTG